MAAAVQQVYFGGELVPAPVLLEVTPAQAPAEVPRVYVNLAPGMFVDASAAERVEGPVTILGTVEQVIEPSDFLSAETWLMPGYDYLLRRIAMTSVGDVIDQLYMSLEIERPTDGVGAYLAGLAILLQAIALY